MRRLVLLSLLVIPVGCGDGGTAVGGGGGSSLGTGDAATGGGGQTDDAATDGPATQDGTTPARGDGAAAQPDLPEVPCDILVGMCPNACEHGASGDGGSCVTDVDCGCGLCCGFGMCKPFDEQGCESFALLAGCLCLGEDANPVDPIDDSPPWQVDPIGYGDDCSTKTPVGSDCNPFCQLGCPAGSHCALIDDDGFTCVTSGAGGLGATCENSSECAAWYSCFGTFDAPEDTCRQVCDADEECPGGQDCNLKIQFQGAGDVSFCDTALLACNIWMPDCPPNMKCVLSQGQAVCAESTWDGIENYPCEELGDCVVGLQCVGLGCVAICSTADTTPLGATPCSELCPDGWQSVDLGLQIGRCSTPEQQ